MTATMGFSFMWHQRLKQSIREAHNPFNSADFDEYWNSMARHDLHQLGGLGSAW